MKAMMEGMAGSRLSIVVIAMVLCSSGVHADTLEFTESGSQGSRIIIGGPGGSEEVTVPKNMSATECAKAAERAAKRAGLDVKRNKAALTYEGNIELFVMGGCGPIRKEVSHYEQTLDMSAANFLIESLAHDSSRIRANAILGIKDLDWDLQPVLNNLVAHIENPDERVVEFVNGHFEELGDRSVNVLSRALFATSWKIRQSAYLRLRSIQLQRGTSRTTRMEISRALQEDFSTSPSFKPTAVENWPEESQQVLSQLTVKTDATSHNDKEPSSLEISPDDRLRGLIDCLSHKDWAVRQSAANAIAQLGETAIPALDKLVERLGDEEFDSSEAAAGAIRVVDPDGAHVITKLCQATMSPKSGLRASATQLLGQYGDNPIARKCLLERLDFPDVEVAWLAAHSLEPHYDLIRSDLVSAMNSDSTQARQLAIQMVGAKEEDATAPIIEGIRKISIDSQSPSRFTARRAVSKVEKRLREPAKANSEKHSYFVEKVRLLTEALSPSKKGKRRRGRKKLNPIIRDIIENVLNSSSDSEAYMVFTWMTINLDNFDTKIAKRLSESVYGALSHLVRKRKATTRSRELALQLIANRPSEKTLSTLLWALADPKITNTAFEALVPYGKSLVWKLLIELPKTRSRLARSQMELLLSTISGSNLLKYLKDDIEKCGSDTECGNKVAVLGKYARADRTGMISSYEIVDILLDLVEQDRQEIRETAALGLIACGDVACDSIFLKLRMSDNKDLLLTVLVKIAESKKISYAYDRFCIVYDIFRDGSDHERALAAVLLKEFGKEAAEEIAEPLDSSFPSERDVQLATTALIAIGKPAVSVVLKRLKGYSISEDKKYERLATILLNIGKPAIPPLIDTLSGSDDNQRFWAIQLLNQLKATEARSALEALARNSYEDEQLRNLAAGVAQKLPRW